MSAPSAPPSRGATLARTSGRVISTLGHRALELRGSRTETVPGAIPATAGAIDRRWLSAALGADVPGAEVLEVEAHGASSQTTSRVALRLTWSDAGRGARLPERVFVKLTASARQRLFCGLIRILDGEPRFYRDLRPQLDLECPEGFFGAWDDRSWRSVVVLEDIAATRGATFCHADSDVSRADMESLLDVMATYHAAMWGSPLLAELKTPLDHFHNTSAFLNMRKRCAVGIRRAGAVVPPSIRDGADALWEAFIGSMRHTSEGPMTLLHGDTHVGNTYRTGAGAMAFADWQVIMRGRWGFDYAYAVSTALAIEDRRAWERELLEFYLERLARAGGPAPDFDDAWRTYRRCLMYPLHTFTTVLGRSAVQPEMQPDHVCKLIIERVGHAIADLDAVAAARGS